MDLCPKLVQGNNPGHGSPGMLHNCLSPTSTVSSLSLVSHGPLCGNSFAAVDAKQFSERRNKGRPPLWSLPLPISDRLKSGRVCSGVRKWCGAQPRAASAIKEEEKKDERRKRRGPAFKCLAQIATTYNQIVILEAPETSSSQYAGSRVLLLDHSGNVHSIYNRGSAWTSSYWDEFASLPAVIPSGPVAIFGLGGGTAARLLLELWPSLRIEGFEIDEILMEQARLHLGLSDLEVPTSEGGCLTVHVDDAFSPSAAIDGGFAGIIVDLFSEGGVVEELQQPQTWINLQKRLRPGGRIMVNCGGVCVEKGDPKTNVDDGTWTWVDGGASKDATLSAMSSAFQGQVNWRSMDSEADNCLALSGPLPDLESWAAALPERLKEGVSDWRPFA